jgi:metalloendopeptidase OMA1, mitochondrial
MLISRRTMLQHAALSTFAGFACCGCRSAPMTGRKQLLIMPETQELSLGQTAFQEVITTEASSQNQLYIDLVSRVGDRVAKVANKPDYQWEFHVIASPEQNAFCLPGGKVAVYEGILPVCANEAGLAVVMSHEIAHALARHGGERMSQQTAANGIKQVVSTVTQQRYPEKHQLLMQAYGLGTEYGVLLPYSRKQESEADHIGVMLMAQAGYDPTEAPRFWQRFGQVGGEKPPEFLSTHPADQRRAADLLALMDEAQSHYATAAPRFGIGEQIVQG